VATATFWKRIDNASVASYPRVDTGATSPDASDEAHRLPSGGGDHGTMSAIRQEHRAIADCECGARFAGAEDAELFGTAQRHLAHHYSLLLGAMGHGVVAQMAEDAGG
jgi:hypothetical protein